MRPARKLRQELQHNATESFILKPFVHSPDAVIKIGDNSAKEKWVTCWTRRCGNPKHSKKTVRIE